MDRKENSDEIFEQLSKIFSIRNIFHQKALPKKSLSIIDSPKEKKTLDKPPSYKKVSKPVVSGESHFKEFFSEANEYLKEAEEILLALEKENQNQVLIQSLCRTFHTIKGMASFLALNDIVRLAHELETFLDHCEKFQTKHFDLMFNAVDTMRQLIVSSIEADQAYVEITIQKLDDIIENLKLDEDFDTEKQATVRLNAPTIQSTKDQIERKTQQIDPNIKVKIDKIDKLIDWVGELVTIQAMIRQDVNKLAISEEQRLGRDVNILYKITRELQELAMSMRMVPIRDTFQRMSRVARDVSSQLNKAIHLEIQGEDTELDRNIVEKIQPALLHMVRNAIDHGIEPLNVRMRMNKDHTGKILLKAFHKGDKFIIIIQDDGKGLDAKTILEKAYKKNLVKNNASLNIRQIYQLIFQPGFTTTQELTDISGRGVGMDVVKKTVDKLQGKIDIQSTLHKGTTFTIHIPLTLGIIDAIIVRTGKSKYIVPTSSIQEFLCISNETNSSFASQKNVLLVRGNTIPVFNLTSLLRGDLSPDQKSPKNREIGLVIKYENRYYCIKVDEIIGQQQVVIKNLGQKLKGLKGISGGAILADGKVGLILDLGILLDTQ